MGDYLANYLYYGGNGPMMVAVTWTLGALGTLVIVLRTISRLTIIKDKGGWPLFWALVSYCHAITASSLYTVEALYGDFNHLTAVASDPYLPWVTELDWITANIVNFATLYGKFSAAAFIFGIIGRTQPWVRKGIIALLAVATVSCIVMVALIFSQCIPSAKLWTATMDGYCNPEERLFAWAVFAASWGALTDLVLALYPVILLARLQKEWKKKALASVLMGMGVFTAVCSIIKAVHFAGLEIANDVTFVRAVLCLFGVIEMWVVLIASGLAPLWPMAQRCIAAGKKTLSYIQNSSSNEKRSGRSAPIIAGDGSSISGSSAHGSFQRPSTSSTHQHALPGHVVAVKSSSSTFFDESGQVERGMDDYSVI